MTLSDPRGRTLVRFEFEQMCSEVHTGVRSKIAHGIDQGDDMTIVETRPEARPAMRWTEVCAADHFAPVRRASRHHQEPGSVKVRPASRPARDAERSMVGERGRPSARGHVSAATLVAPGRRVLVRPAHAGTVRACRVEAPSVAGVVDDVPTWVLLACGVAFGVILLLALAFLGGPAYA